MIVIHHENKRDVYKMKKPTLSLKDAMPELAKKIVIPIDGSKNALKSLDYLELIYGPGHNLDVNLLYVLPSLPPILTKEITMDKRLQLTQSDVKKRMCLWPNESWQKPKMFS